MGCERGNSFGEREDILVVEPPPLDTNSIFSSNCYIQSYPVLSQSNMGVVVELMWIYTLIRIDGKGRGSAAADDDRSSTVCFGLVSSALLLWADSPPLLTRSPPVSHLPSTSKGKRGAAGRNPVLHKLTSSQSRRTTSQEQQKVNPSSPPFLFLVVGIQKEGSTMSFSPSPATAILKR